MDQSAYPSGISGEARLWVRDETKRAGDRQGPIRLSSGEKHGENSLQPYDQIVAAEAPGSHHQVPGKRESLAWK